MEELLRAARAVKNLPPPPRLEDVLLALARWAHGSGQFSG